MLLIEIDGKYHNEAEQKENDRLRTQALNGKNIKVLRFTNEQVLNYTDKMLEKILEFLQKSPDL
jgi:very-short-patch-repair endonuclease